MLVRLLPQVVQPVAVLAPTFEQHHDGFGVQCARPRISWRFAGSSGAEGRDWRQTAHEIEVCAEDGGPGQIFNVESCESVLVPWPSPESLPSRARRLVRVRCQGNYSVSDHRDSASWTEWSPWSLLEIALLHKSDWVARMITVQDAWPLNPDGSARPMRFYKRLDLPQDQGTITRARLYITSHGLYTVHVNGKAVGNHCLSPGFQSYHKRLHYQVFDVKHMLTSSGPNTIEVEVAAGWFASALTWARKRFIYGQKLGVLAQLEIGDANSPMPMVVSTDNSWSASTTALISSDIYDGEVYDYRLEGAMTSPGDATDFKTQELLIPVSRLVSPDAPPVRVVEKIEPQELFKSRSGKSTIIDFGQNFAGRIRVRNVRKAAGSAITFRHAEVMQDGEIMCSPLRSAKATDVLICDGCEIRDWRPKYVFHGFRFVEITGWGPEDGDCPLTKTSMVAEILHTDMARTGWFSCSDELVTRLHENSLWSMKSNFLSVPTECPSRDERLGWTGDLNIFAPTATFLYDTAGMLRHWLDDLYLDQMEPSIYWQQGVVPLFIPNCLLRTDDKGPAWGPTWDPMPNGVWADAAVMVPWQLYRTSGDISFLSRQYDSMVQYLERGVPRGEDGLWDPEQWQFGDWLDPRAPVNDSGRGTTDGTYVADCFLIESTRVVSETAGLLVKPTDVTRFRDMHAHLTQSWRSKYLSPAGLVTPDTATAISLALAFNLLPESEGDQRRKQAVSRVTRIVRLNDFKITHGFVGNAFLSSALTQAGEVGMAYAMLFQKEYPSYLYPVTMGATTTWERWDSMLPDGTVNSGSMTSFNHHALGSIAHWLHAEVGGLEALEPGWKVFRVKPQPNKELAWAETVFESKYGRIELKWTLEGDQFRMTLSVPPNSSAIVSMPCDDPRKTDIERRVGSGRYLFECCVAQPNWPPKALLPPWGRDKF